MIFIIKLFPEIIIKSKSIRLKFIQILYKNIFSIVKKLNINFKLIKFWDKIEIIFEKNIYYNQIQNILKKIPGIHHTLLVEKYKFYDLHHISKLTLFIYSKLIKNKTFCVRVNRIGNHEFNSIYAENYIGEYLNKKVLSSSVNLKYPDVLIKLEVINDNVFFVKKRINGIGGFPIGTQGSVLSLISGGFDSSVASYMLISRGCIVNYCYFDFGISKYLSRVKSIVYHIWSRYSSSHNSYFLVVNFYYIVIEIFKNVRDKYMGIVLKRIMLKISEKLMKFYNITALSTGDSIGQVSSQTLHNLNTINSTINSLILRPLISFNKEDIIKISKDIGTYDCSSKIPEFCGFLSKHPSTKASEKEIEKEEKKINISFINEAFIKTKRFNIKHELKHNVEKKLSIEVVNFFSTNDIIIDIRNINSNNCLVPNSENALIISIPFFKLEKKFLTLNKYKTYLLYCDKGMISYLQAVYLHKKGFRNVKVYRP